MKLLSYDGYLFSSGGYHAGLSDADARQTFEMGQQIQPRQNASPLSLGGIPTPRTIAATFTYDGTDALTLENAFGRLLGKLRPRISPPGGRILIAERNDGTDVQAHAVVTLPGGWDQDFDVSTLLVTFTVIDLNWQAVDPTTDGPTVFAAAGSRTLTVTGYDEITPLVKVAPTAARPSANSIVGWSRRAAIDITNSSTQTWKNYPVQLGPFDTAAQVTASLMQADGDDWVPFNDKGERMRRTVVAPNTKASFLNFVIAELAAGDTKTFDICWGNPSATHDPTNNGFPYSYFGSPAIDTGGFGGTATAGAASTISTGVTVEANAFVGATIIATGGTGIGQRRIAVSHTTGGVYTTDRPWTTNPDATTTYVIVRSAYMATGGNASTTSATSLTDASHALNINQWIGATIEEYSVTTGLSVTSATVTANTATGFTVDAWSAGTPGVGAKWRVINRNAHWIWHVERRDRDDTNFRGRYRLSSGQVRPSNVWWASDGAPAAWSPDTYNPGQASNDYSQVRMTPFDIGGGDNDWFASLNASIARKDGARLTEEGFANGLKLSVPLGALGIKHDFAIKNPSGMARAVFGAREQGGEDWSLYKEYSTTQASLTSTAVVYYDLTGYGRPLHLLAALTSDDDADIEDTQTETANLRDGDILELFLDTRRMSVGDIATATVQTVYDTAFTVRRGGATEAVGDDLIRIGGDDHHLFLGYDEEIWIGDDGNVPYAARVYGAPATATLAVDPFTVANGTALETYDADWIKHASSGAGSATIDTNRAHNANSATIHIYYRNDWTPADADYDVACDVVMRSDNNASFAGPAARISVAADTNYAASYNTSANGWQLYKNIAGAATQLGSTVAATLTVDQAYRCVLSVNGSLIRVYVDGVLIIAQVDTAITAAGRAGIRIGQAATSTIGVHLDNFAAYQGGQSVVRDVPNSVRLYSVEADREGVAARSDVTTVLPMQPGSVDAYVADEDGSQGSLSVEFSWKASYL